jgi:SAM-dependent methyltransferase
MDQTDEHAETRRIAAEMNRQMWNQTAAVHEARRFADLAAAFADPAFSTLDELERSVFATIGVEGKAVAQLSCNNGRELISVERLGASKAVGFDISDAFVDQGRRLARAAGSRATFERTNVYDIEPRFDACFDILYVTVGALGWLADLPAWYRVVSRLLRPGGALFIYEMHPILDMFDPVDGTEAKHSYFRTDPDVVEEAADYLAPDIIVSAASVWFHHTIGDIIGGAIRAGLQLTEFAEHPFDRSATYRSFEEQEARLPLSYHLVARKS